MITVTITIGAILGFSALGYFTYDWRKKALDFKVKFESTKEFADASARHILKLENKNAELASKVVELKNKNVMLESAATVAKASEKPANNAPTMKPQNNGNGNPGKKRGPKPRNKQ